MNRPRSLWNRWPTSWVVKAILEARRSVRPVASFLLAWGLLQAAVLAPLLGWAGAHLTTRNGELAISNYDIASFLLSPRGLFFLIAGGTLNLALIYAQHAGLFVIASQPQLGAVPSLTRLLWRNAQQIPGLVRLGLWQLLGFGLLLAPFGLAALAIARSLLGDYDVNYYLATQPRAWVWTVRLTFLLLGVYGALAVLLYLRWILAVPHLLVSGESPLRCLKMSWRATRGRVHRAALPFVLWWAAWLVTGAVIAAGFTFVARALVEAAGASLPRLIPVLMVLETMVFVGGLLGAYVGGVVHQFLLAHLYWDLHPRSRVTEEDASADSRVLPPGLKPALGVAAATLLAVSGFGTWQYITRIDSGITVQITAHRGSSRRAPENSLSALQQAILEGADYAEIDVQSTRDGQVVLLHDGDLMRVAGDPRRVGDMTLEELRELDLGSWFSRQFAGERVATLEEAINLVRGRLKLNIELKYNRPDPALGERVLRILRTKRFVSECVITSLSADELMRLGRQAPELRTGLIVTAALGDTTRMPVAFLSMNTAQVSYGSVKLAHRQGKAVHVWTVNDRGSALRMIDLGVDNLITDEPEMMVTLRKELRRLNQAELVVLSLRTRFLP